MPQGWYIITSEYPPQPGGVSDYTHIVAGGLAAAGDKVHVWCPGKEGNPPSTAGVVVRPELDNFGPTDWTRVGNQLDEFEGPRRILVQWVAQGYGYRSMNLPFCLWLWKRAAKDHDKVEIMVHEAFLPFGEGTWRQNLVALTHRLMTIILLRAASRVWVSIPDWERLWHPYTLGRRIPFTWLPVPSNIGVAGDAKKIADIRHRYTRGGGVLLGHFGTYDLPRSSLLEPLLNAILADESRQSFLLMGRGSEEFAKRLLQIAPEHSSRIYATGGLPPEDLSHHISACDILVQPYSDGVSARRTSFMLGLSHGRPIVTTLGLRSEGLWKDTDAVLVAPANDLGAMVDLVRQLRDDELARRKLADAAVLLYQRRFDIQHVIAALRGSDDAVWQQSPEACDRRSA